MPKSATSYAKGLTGEEKALEYLMKRGMAPLERRYHSPYGEIDLIMQDGDAIAFVEVKARSAGRRGAGLCAITKAKQRRLVQTALAYIAQHRPECPLRFDALEITPQGIVYVKNAFDAGADFG
ncbi:MAG: YraN family protein [Candidatus Limiplasma sp.]|nr:YraN family protein [Candidatus Limiplasma sp.]